MLEPSAADTRTCLPPAAKTPLTARRNEAMPLHAMAANFGTGVR